MSLVNQLCNLIYHSYIIDGADSNLSQSSSCTSPNVDLSNDEFDVEYSPLTVCSNDAGEDYTIRQIEGMSLNGGQNEDSGSDWLEKLVEGTAGESSVGTVVEAGSLRSPVPSPPVCYICKGYMFAPVYICSAGHSICSFCREKCNICPFCMEFRTWTRNRYIEDLAGVDPCPCKFRESGCNFMINPDKWNMHVASCNFNPMLSK